MMNLLHTIGLMTRAEHERIVADNDEKSYAAWAKMADERDEMSASRTELMHSIAKLQVETKRLTSGWDKCGDELKAMTAKFKRAATDLEKQIEETNCYADKTVELNEEIGRLRAEIAALRPDAEAMRKKRAADRKRMAGKRNG